MAAGSQAGPPSRCRSGIRYVRTRRAHRQSGDLLDDLFDGVDLSRTVGWFTNVHPVVLEAGGALGAAVMRTKETLRNVPDRGLGYALMPGFTRTGSHVIGPVDSDMP